MRAMLRMMVVAAAAVTSGLLAPVAGHASVITYDDRAAWEAAAPGFAGVDLAGFPEFSLIGFGAPIALPLGGAVSFDSDLVRLQVPTSWGTWSGGKEPAILYAPSTLVTGTFAGSPIGGFGLEMEPNTLDAFLMTLALDDGSTLSQSVTGDAGAAFFGWHGSGVTAMTLGCEVCDFAFGEMVQAPAVATEPVPEPATLLLLGSGLALGAWRARARASKN